MKEKLLDWLDKSARSPFAFAVAVAGYFLVVFGMIDAYEKLKPKLGAEIATATVAIPLIASAVVFALPFFWSFRRHFRLPLNRNYFLRTAKQKWHFHSDGTRSFTHCREMVFYRQPHKTDLSDTIFGSRPLTFQDIAYESPDATVSGVEQLNDRAVRVFWIPPQAPNVGDTLSHKSSCKYFADDDQSFKAITIGPTVHVVRAELKIAADTPMKMGRAFKGRIRHKYDDNRKLMERLRKLRKFNCPQPTIEDGTAASITLQNLQPGDLYFIIFEF